MLNVYKLFARETHVRFIGTYVHAYICMSIQMS